MDHDRTVAIGGQDCLDEALDEMVKPASPYLVSISHLAETYGDRLITLGMAIIRQQAVPPYNFTQHRVVTQESLLKDKLAASPTEKSTRPVAKKAGASATKK